MKALDDGVDLDERSADRPQLFVPRHTRIATRLRLLMTDKIAAASTGFVLLLVLVALLAPPILRMDPNKLGTTSLAAPSGAHILGTDQLGRDGLLQLVYGTRVSVEVGFLAALSTLVIGVLLGTLAGYAGSLVDIVLMRIAEIFQTMPTFILAAVIVAVLGAGIEQIILVIALLAWPQTARVMRGEILRLKSLGYVLAARCQGLPEWRIVTGDVMKNALGPVIPTAAIVVAQAILLQSGLAFLGLGNAGVVSWGKMLNDGQDFITSAWWMTLFPGLAILFTVVACNILSDALGDMLDSESPGKSGH